MKIIVAPDSFKGSLTQIEAAEMMKEAAKEINPQHDVIMKPMADGGEGTLDALLAASEGSERIPIEVVGPLGENIHTHIGIVQNDTAVIEVAAICGLPLVPEDQRNPYETTTYGIGQAIKLALDRGIRQFVVGLGGSATNDGGLGMFLALGAKMHNIQGEQVGIYGKDLLHIHSIDLSELDPRLKQARFRIASDVDNPLYGERGATHVFGPQKGATDKQINMLDRAMKTYSHLLEKASKVNGSLIHATGAGAAGGLGFAFLQLKADMMSGAKLIAETIGLEDEIEHADLVLTGEGKSDAQTLYGKAPGFVAALAKKYKVPVILISGSISDSEGVLKRHFSEVYELLEENVTVERAMKEANMLLLKKVKAILRRSYLW